VWVLLEFIGLLVLFAACVYVLVRIVRRQDLAVGGKVVWIVAFIMFPPGALLAYLIGLTFVGAVDLLPRR
jgi:hypothetical protein